MQRIVLLSSERSGSNLVRSLYGRSRQIDAPAAAQILKAVLPFCGRVLPCSNPAIRRRLVRAVVDLTKWHPLPWRPAIAPGEVEARLATDGWDGIDLFDACYRVHAEKMGCQGYFIKENNTFDFAEDLARRFPGAVFIYLIRDPRDVFLSFKNVPGGPNRAEVFTSLWAREQKRCLSFLERSGDGRTWVVRYEDLIENPRTEVRRLYQVAGLEYDDAVVVGGTGGQAVGPYFQNISGKVNAANKQKYRKGLTRREIAIIESGCADIMARFGYEPDLPVMISPSHSPSAGGQFLDRGKSMAKALYLLGLKESWVRLRRWHLYRRIKGICNQSA